jgi:hypothetical protein
MMMADWWMARQSGAGFLGGCWAQTARHKTSVQKTTFRKRIRIAKDSR